MESLKNKVVVITGGPGVIGVAVVKELLDHGVRGIAILDKNEQLGITLTEKIANDYGNGKAIFIRTDITNKKEVEEAFDTVIQIYNQLDIVINNAAIIDEYNWEEAVSVNFVALTTITYMAMQKYLPKYKSKEEGIIVNTASILGFLGLQSTPIYCATKHAIVGLGQSLGGDEFYNKYKVRILTICPGAVDTPFITVVDDRRYLFPEKMTEHLEMFKKSLLSPESVGKALIEVIKKGRNGSLWVVEKKEMYEAVVPHPKWMKVQEKN